jgi:hypothetical protein
VDQDFDTMRLPGTPDAVAPDGSDVRVLLRLGRGSMAHFELAAGRVSPAHGSPTSPADGDSPGPRHQRGHPARAPAGRGE